MRLSRFFLLISIFFFLLNACTTSTDIINQTSFVEPPPQLIGHSAHLPLYQGRAPYTDYYDESKYVALLPRNIGAGTGNIVLVDPKIFAWGAYDKNGNLVRGGIATAGANFCRDKGRPCRTTTGVFKVYALGNAECRSKSYPIPHGGALMPYCMFFHNGESLHGSPDPMLVEANISHGCVHLRIPDAEWLRYHFVHLGTKIIILPY